VIQKDLVTFGFAKVAPSEVIRKISQNFSPAGVTSPFVARAIVMQNLWQSNRIKKTSP